MWLLYVQLLGGQNRYGLVCAIMINPPELNNEARNNATVLAQKTKRETTDTS